MTTETVPGKKLPKNQPSISSKPMSPVEFKDEVRGRGWTYKILAERWGVTANWISKTARNDKRALHWDDAVRGLPILLDKTKK